MNQSMGENNVAIGILLRAASRCGARCSVDVVTVHTPGQAPTFIAKHNGRDVEIPLGDMDNPMYDAFEDVRQRWVSKAADLHREDVMQSDWPVF